MLAGAQADVGPRLARIGGLVDAVTPAHALAIRTLAGSDPDDVRIRLEDGDVAHRMHGLLREHRPQ